MSNGRKRSRQWDSQRTGLFLMGSGYFLRLFYALRRLVTYEQTGVTAGERHFHQPPLPPQLTTFNPPKLAVFGALSFQSDPGGLYSTMAAHKLPNGMLDLTPQAAEQVRMYLPQ